MAATVIIQEWNGSSGSQVGTDKTSGTIRFKNADNKDVDLNNPMVKGGASDYSFEKWLRVRISGGTFTQITGVKAYSDGGNGWTGVNLNYKTAAAYATPAEGTGAWGGTSFFTKTSGSPITLGAGPFDSTGLPKDVGDFLELMMEVTTGANGGVLATETITIGWDEI